VNRLLHQFAIAESLDPVAPEIQYQMVYVLLAASRCDEAATHCGKLPADFWGKDECTGRVRLSQGKTLAAIQLFETAYRRGLPAGSAIRGYLGYAYARAATAAGPYRIAWVLAFPEFAVLRGDPRVTVLRKTLGLPE